MDIRQRISYQVKQEERQMNKKSDKLDTEEMLEGLKEYFIKL